MIGKYTMSPDEARETMRNGCPERKRGGNDMRMSYEGREDSKVDLLLGHLRKGRNS